MSPTEMVVQAGPVTVLVADVLSIARSAGEAILDVYKSDVEVSVWDVRVCVDQEGKASPSPSCFPLVCSTPPFSSPLRQQHDVRTGW